MQRDIRYFIAQTKYNIKNAHALRRSFWIGVFGMMLNNVTFFVIWFLFMQATGPINGWTSADVFGMLGVAMIAFGVTFSFFHGIVELPQLVLRGSFDSVLLSPVNAFLKLAGMSFAVTAHGDLLMGALVAIFYGLYSHFSMYLWLLYMLAILSGCITFACIRLLCSLVTFFIHDGEIVAGQLFEIFLRPGLYPGAIFPSGMKIFFMTVIPALITSAVPIDTVKGSSLPLIASSLSITALWLAITALVFRRAVKRYESGNFLR